MTAAPRRRAETGENGGRRDLSRPPAPEPLPHPVTDNHCHLDIGDGDDDFTLADALAAAGEVNVHRIVQVGCDLRGARWAVETAEQHPQLVAAVALHPNEAPVLAERGELEAALAEIEQLAARDVVRAVGETGLDHFRTGPEGRGVQEESFRQHIRIAKRLGKALTIHDRDAHEDVLRVVLDEGPPDHWVMHCFSGDVDFGRRCVEAGAHLSFAGTVTFKNAGPLRDALRATPVDRILVETDAPFLTPHPYRGRPNASYLVPQTMRLMSEVTGVELGELCAAVEANTTRVYGDW
ncbi:TatD family hydrolase [Nocardioides alcanivorans]|uniref:TatD family hydrolase n=1 Tax=Nocardioides alcanivorans TaxID=2897352 RepID=UPI001F433746|nr:TatD family hydrolase [Nocardioides alcanivorans]